MKYSMLFKWILMLLALFFAYSCEYEPQGIYEVEVEPVTEIPNISINLNFESDTIYIPTERSVMLHYSVDDNLVRHAHFYLNNNQLATIESSSGSFYIEFKSGPYIKNHAYELKVDIFRGSGSESLADKVNMEGFLYSKSFTLYFIDNSQMAAQITSVIPENGSLKIQWEKYKGLGFRNYHVFNSVFYKIAIISDWDQTWLYDESYIGYNGNYYVITETEYDSYKSESVFYNHGLPKASVSHIDDMNLKVIWGRSKFENNIIGYKIYEWYRRFDITNEIAFVENIADTSFLYKDGRFAVKTKYFIQPIPKEGEVIVPDSWGLWNLTSPTNDITIGDKMPVFPFTFFNKPLGNFCYYSNSFHILKFDCTKEAFTDSISTQNICSSSSQDGTLLLSKNGNQLEVINANSMTTTNIITIDELPDANEPYQFVINNNKTGVFNNHLADFYFFDYKNKKTLAKFKIDGHLNFGDVMKVSVDGKYFCVRHIKGIYPNYITELFKLEDGSVKTVISDPEITFFDFNPGNDHFVYFKNQKLITISLHDMSIQYKREIGDELFYDIDWGNDEYLTLSSSRDLFSISDLESGTLKKQVKTIEFGTNQSDYSHIYLSNKTLFTQGLRIKLNY